MREPAALESVLFFLGRPFHSEDYQKEQIMSEVQVKEMMFHVEPGDVNGLRRF